MNDPQTLKDALSLAPFVKSLIGDFCRAGRNLLVFDVVFQILRAWLMTPLIALLLAFILLQTNYAAISNQDLIGFLLTPLGGLYVALLSAATATLFLLEQAGMLAVITVVFSNRSTRHLTGMQSFRMVLKSIWRISQLGMMKIVLLLLALSPLVALTLIIYFSLLTQYDIYFYLNDRPREFWIAAGLGSVLFLAAVVLGGSLLVRWSLALPIALLEAESATVALAISRQRVQGVAWPIAKLVFCWMLGLFTLGALAAFVGRMIVSAALLLFGKDSLPTLSILLALQAILLTIHSFLSSASLALMIHRLYWLLSPHLKDVGEPQASLSQASSIQFQSEMSQPAPFNGGRVPAPFWLKAPSWGAAMMMIVSPFTMWGVFAEMVAHRDTVLVSAHRGDAKQAPENTLIAIQKAIDIGADYVEIDVHQTLDGVVVLLHDRDLRRVAGDSRRLDQVTFEEVRQLDVGSWFSPQFADQRVPTLQEVIQLCRGKIRLNIEMKVFGSADSLARAVTQVIREEHFESECILTSLSTEAIVAVRRNSPELLVGIIIGHSIGNVNRLDVDALSVRAEHLSNEMIRAAHQQGRQVMVWGMNGEQQMIQQLRRGVDNLITSEPKLAMQLRDRWRDLSDHERLVIACHILLGIAGH